MRDTLRDTHPRYLTFARFDQKRKSRRLHDSTKKEKVGDFESACLHYRFFQEDAVMWESPPFLAHQIFFQSCITPCGDTLATHLDEHVLDMSQDTANVP
jgi:hypothetical protein